MGFSVNVGGQVVEMILTLQMLQTRHGSSLYHLAEGRRHQRQCLRRSGVPSEGASVTCGRGAGQIPHFGFQIPES